MPSHLTSLSDRAERLLPPFPSKEPSPLSQLEEELRACLDQLCHAQSLYQDHLRSLVQDECRAESDHLQLQDSYAPSLSPVRLRARQTLHDRLLQLNRERRQLQLLHQRDLRDLHLRLLHVLVQHGYLAGG